MAEHAPSASPDAAPAPPGDAPALIEVGWVLAGGLDDDDRAACRTARAQMAQRLRELFPTFRWRFPAASRADFPVRRLVEPVDLLDLGVAEREARRWDFALVVTGAELESYYKPYALATPSKATAVACLSTARLDLRLEADEDLSDEMTLSGRDPSALGGRLFALAMHAFGDLCGIPHADEATDFMWTLDAVADLDAMATYSERDRNALHSALVDVADARLEEVATSRVAPAAFYVRTVLTNGRDILGALLQIKPWLFPFQFSKLTLAAASTLVVLLITEEAWTVGTSQSATWVVVFSVLALALTSAFVIKRQHLLIRRGRRQPTEQVAVANVSVALAVAFGMATTYALLFALTLGISLVLFPPDLVADWVGRPVSFDLHAELAGFSATLGLLIGALGASFEDEAYFRHVTYIDEEV